MSNGASLPVDLVKTAGEPRDFPRAELPEVAAMNGVQSGDSMAIP